MSLLLLWSVCLVLNGLTVSAQELGVSMQFAVNFVVVNNHASATCQATGYDSSIHTINSFSWQHNGSVINLQNSKYIQSGTGDATRSLEINDLTFEDAGTYTCIIAYSGGPQPEVSGQATLQIATELTVEAEPIQYSVIGQTAQLRCTVESNPLPRIIWYNGTTETPENALAQGDSTDSNFGVYTIPNVQPADAGSYLCTGSYSFGRETVGIELVILNEPTIISQQFNGEVPFGNTLTLPCTVSADSQTPIHPVTHQWTFTRTGTSESIVLTEEGLRYSVDVDGGLTITDLAYQDGGTYTCTVRNEAGMAEQVNTITVIGPARITLEEGPLTERVGSTYTTVFLHCPFVGNPPPTLRWFKGESRIETSLPDSNFRVHSNGTLQIFDLSQTTSTEYRCDVENSIGSDSRMYAIQVWTIPPQPSNLVKTKSLDDDRTVTLSWIAPSTAEFQDVEFYIIEQSLNGGEFEQLDDVSPTDTSVTLSQLLPGEMYEWRVSAGNIAGVSAPSNTLTYTPEARKPSLSSFQVTALPDGRSVLVRWILEFDGGPDITTFTIQALINDTVTVTQSVDVTEGEFTLTGLEPDTQYTFIAAAVNDIGSTTAEERQTTTSAAPSEPSSLSVTLLSSGAYSLSFTLKQGSRPITHYLINHTQVDSTEPPSQLIVAADDPVYVTSMVETDSQSSSDTEYHVVLNVAGLDRTETFEFRVAGRSELGDGEFSEWARIPEKGHVIYVIIAVVVGGMLLVVVVILTTVIIAVCRKRCNKGRKIAINGNGSPFPHSDIDVESNNNSDAFILKSPPIGRKPGSFHKTPPVCITPSTEDRDEINSPLYSYPNNGYPHSNGSSVNKLNTQTSISGSNLDTVVDMPNNNLRIVKDFHSSTKSVPNTSGYSPPAGDKRQHLCLQTSLNSMNLDHGEHNDGRSVVSEKHLLMVPTNNGNTLSKSTPVIHRLSCDSVLDTAVTSYMTDV